MYDLIHRALSSVTSNIGSGSSRRKVIRLPLVSVGLNRLMTHSTARRSVLAVGQVVSVFRTRSPMPRVFRGEILISPTGK